MNKEYSQEDLQKALDKTQVSVFRGKNSAFYSPLMLKTEIKFTKDVDTFLNDGVSILINPDRFMQLSRSAKDTAFMHEILHIAKLHNLRGHNKELELWTKACNLKINNELVDMGLSFKDLDPNDYPILRDSQINSMSEEELYVYLKEQQQQQNNKQNKPSNSSGSGNSELEDTSSGDQDLNPDGNPQEDKEGNSNNSSKPKSKEELANQNIRNVMMAKEASIKSDPKGSKELFGSQSGNIEDIITEFFKPKILWGQELEDYFRELEGRSCTWKRPNRRYSDIYLPSWKKDPDGLITINVYIDCSGSISDINVKEVASECKYIFETFHPRELNIIEFDTKITNITKLSKDDEFKAFRVVGRGGTSLDCVIKDINIKKPEVAIIFSDLEADPFEEPETETDVIFLVLENSYSSYRFKPNFGREILYKSIDSY